MDGYVIFLIITVTFLFAFGPSAYRRTKNHSEWIFQFISVMPFAVVSVVLLASTAIAIGIHVNKKTYCYGELTSAIRSARVADLEGEIHYVKQYAHRQYPCDSEFATAIRVDSLVGDMLIENLRELNNKLIFEETGVKQDD